MQHCLYLQSAVTGKCNWKSFSVLLKRIELTPPQFNENTDSQAGCDSSATSFTSTIGCIVKKVQRGAQVSLYNTGDLNKYCNVDVMPEDVTSSYTVEWDFTKKCIYLKDCAYGMPRGEWKSHAWEIACHRFRGLWGEKCTDYGPKPMCLVMAMQTFDPTVLRPWISGSANMPRRKGYPDCCVWQRR